jgi:hypothetical protein
MGVGGAETDVEIGKSQGVEAVESKPTEPIVETPVMKVCFWLSNVLGLLCGLMYGGAGFGKVTGAMDDMLSTVHAPFYGVPVVAFKVLAFFGHLTGGVCMIGGIIAMIVMKFQGKKAELLETLILMDSVGMCTIAIGAVFLHLMMGMPWFTPLIIVLPLPLLRFGYNGWALPQGNVLSTSFPNKSLFLVFVGVNVVGFVLSIVMHLTIGTVGILK